MRRKLQEAELRAKQREELNPHILNLEEQKANEKGFTYIRIREKNRTKFSQIIDENIAYLAKTQFLTSAEFSFIFTLAPLLKMNVNAIVHPQTGQYCSVSDIADFLRRSRPKTSSMISTLIDKGMMYEFVNKSELKAFGRHVTARPFFLNPEIICCGDKNKIQSGIIQLMIHHNILESEGVKLPIKAVLSPNAQYGKLVSRKVYLKMKQQMPDNLFF